MNKIKNRLQKTASNIPNYFEIGDSISVTNYMSKDGKQIDNYTIKVKDIVYSVEGKGCDLYLSITETYSDTEKSGIYTWTDIDFRDFINDIQNNNYDIECKKH